VVSVLPVYWGLATWLYGSVAALGGGWFLWRAIVFLRPEGRDRAARRLFLTSILYLPLVLGSLVADRLIFR
jgi:protoheme IX farnesyltransferase